MTLSLVAMTWSFSASRKFAFKGGMSGLGVLSMTSIILLNTSIAFDAPSTNELPPKGASLTFRVNARTGVGFLMSLSSLLFFILSDVLNERDHCAASIMFFVATLGVAISVFVAHVLNGCLETPGYSFFQPGMGGTSFCVLQGFGWVTPFSYRPFHSLP